ncbi:hypothetical protein CVT24_004080 [Panaeolus cyanescens]|uniref:G-alpha-domain-containing protein n=1 Tax=Panaeolus cyanescens TaxID=181874 RepID=A0A409Y616_9AGAR|nr:hypothetical protein CVT24_004080 [Panaeolus cyanescens]
MIFTYDKEVDPLAAFTAPPPNETPEERQIRERKEQEAIQRSRNIEAELKAAKISMKRWKDAVKVLVLGQSMSGKSTTIKNFQITYAQKAWAEERQSWKAVILFNLVHTVNLIVDVVQDAVDRSGRTSEHTSVDVAGRPTQHHHKVLLRLAPLRRIEDDLKTHLGAGTSEVEILSKNLESNGPSHEVELNRAIVQEFTVRSSSGWKSILAQVRKSQSGRESQIHQALSDVVVSCKDDIRWLWNDSVTQLILQSRSLKLDDAPGFFLNDIDRITMHDYEPTDSDIVRARLRTTGVQEYHFTLDRANGTNLDWIMYDVAGIRTSRAAWIPYFREITALIFMAPLSSFNERLAEDNRVNRLEDTFVLWKTICSSELLSHVQIILFMNKVDLLRKKLDQGIQVKKYIPEYDKGNDFATVSTWFRRVFKRIFVDHRKPGSPFISHFTSVVDTQATGQTLQAVQATILRNDIANAGLM